MKHEKFHYKSLDEVKDKCRELGIYISFSNDTSILVTPIKIGPFEVPNRLGIAPMEGADSTEDGKPTSYTERRYVNEARGGAGIIWYEAISIVEEGRSSKTQLLLNEKNLDSFKRLNEKVKEEGLKRNGFAPLLIMQSNHSGRYSNPNNRPSPMIAEHNSFLETFRAADDSAIVSDDYLKRMEDIFGHSALLAREAGFDGVDIKSCHGYLFQEVIAAYNRKGEYGGSYENRVKLLKNSIRSAKVYETPSFFVTSRIGIYDGYPKKSRGFGQDENGKLDLTEPKRLVKELKDELGLSFINITMGNPYATTHVTRPFDCGKYIPDEHPFEGIARMCSSLGEIKKEVPDMTIYGSAPTYLREYSDLYVAGAIEEKLADGFLFGRLSFANPDFPNDIIKNGRIDRNKVCLTCGKCGDLIRSHKPTGCVICDNSTFMPFYKEWLIEKKNLPENFRG